MFSFQDCFRRRLSGLVMVMAVIGLLPTKAQVSGLNSSVVAFVDAETPSGTMDGVNTRFVLTRAPSPVASLSLTRNGVYLSLTQDYSISGNTITFVPGATPLPNDLLRCSYRTTLTALKAGGDGQSAPVGSPFAITLQLSLQDGNANPVQGAVITFTAPNTGPSGTFTGGVLTATATTDGTGKATAPPFIANRTVGRYNVSATITSLMSVTFLLANVDWNLAQKKPATQSSNWTTAGAALAVDGNTDGIFADNSVSHTNYDVNAWWQVDLGSSATINSVVVWNRTDCCITRMNDYWVFASNTPFSAGDTPATLQSRAGTWSSHQLPAPTPSTTIPVGGVQAQYVRVQLSGTNYLHLAEVQVLGTSP